MSDKTIRKHAKSINSESIRLLMFRKRLTRGDLAETLGISKQLVSNYQYQDRWPPKHLLRLITVYGMLEEMVPRSELDNY